MTSGKPIIRSDIVWVHAAQAYRDLAEYRKLAGEDYELQKRSLQDWLCVYFNNSEECTVGAMNISPIRCEIPGAKGFKIRWSYPGSGKSGGLRLAVMAFCKERRVVVCAAWFRKEDPADADFQAAFADA